MSKILARQLMKSLEFLNRILYCMKAVNCFRILTSEVVQSSPYRAVPELMNSARYRFAQ